jgi:hypothetical protein
MASLRAGDVFGISLMGRFTYNMLDLRYVNMTLNTSKTIVDRILKCGEIDLGRIRSYARLDMARFAVVPI